MAPSILCFLGMLGLIVLFHEAGHVVTSGYEGFFAGITYNYGFPHPIIGVYTSTSTVLGYVAGFLASTLPLILLRRHIPTRVWMTVCGIAVLGSTSDFIGAVRLLGG